MEDAAFFRMPGNMDREFDSIMMVGVNDQYGLGGEDRLSLQPSLWGNGEGVAGDIFFSNSYLFSLFPYYFFHFHINFVCLFIFIFLKFL